MDTENSKLTIEVDNGAKTAIIDLGTDSSFSESNIPRAGSTTKILANSVPRNNSFKTIEIFLYIISFCINIYSLIVGFSNDDGGLIFMCICNIIVIIIVRIVQNAQNPQRYFYAHEAFLFMFLLIFILAMPGLGFAFMETYFCGELDCILKQCYAIYYVVFSLLTLFGIIVMAIKSTEDSSLTIYYCLIFALFRKEKIPQPGYSDEEVTMT